MDLRLEFGSKVDYLGDVGSLKFDTWVAYWMNKVTFGRLIIFYNRGSLYSIIGAQKTSVPFWFRETLFLKDYFMHYALKA